METVVLHAPIEFERVASKHARLAGTTSAIVVLCSRGVRREVNRRARAAAVFALGGCRHPFGNFWRSLPTSTTRAHLAHRAAALLSAVRKLALLWAVVTRERALVAPIDVRWCYISWGIAYGECGDN